MRRLWRVVPARAGRAAAPAAGTNGDQRAPQLAALHADLARLGPGADRARLLLSALAWGRGSGLPRATWVTVARALAQREGPGHPAMNDSGVGWLLEVARRWVTTDKRADSTSVYRLADAHLAAELRATVLQGPVAPHDAADVERRITHALVTGVPLDAAGGRDWLLADPYVAAHLAEHAAAAGQGALSELVADATFRAVAEPSALLPLLGAVALSQRDAVRAYRRARPMLGTDPRANAAYLEEAAVALGAAPAGLTGVRPVYQTVLSAMRHDDSLATLAGHTNMINRVVMGTCPDGRVLLATGSDDTTVRVWDALSGELACPVIDGHTDQVWSVALGNCADGRPLLASCGRDKTVRVWDPLTGDPVIDPIAGHTERVYEVAFGNLEGGRLLLASGSGDNTARLWDPLTGAAFGAPLAGHHGRVRGVVFGNLPDGRLLLATSSPDGPVQVWDALKGEPLSPAVTGHQNVYGLDFCPGPDGGLLLCTTGVDGEASFWDPLTAEPVPEPFPALRGPLYSLRFGMDGKGRHLAAYARGSADIHVCEPTDPTRRPWKLASLGGKVQDMAFSPAKREGEAGGGQLLLASAGVDLNVRVWDRLTADGTEPDPADPVEPGWVRSLVFGDGPAGNVLLASATGGNDLCLWDPRVGVRVRQLPTGGDGWVDCAAFGAASDGRLLLASAGRDGVGDGASIQVWNPMTGEVVTGPLTGHGESVRSLAFGMGPGGRLLLASASDDGTVRVWDSLTGAPLGRPVAAHSDRVESVTMVSVAGRGLLMASGGGDGAVRLWDPVAGTPAAAPLSGHTDRVTSVAFGTDATGQLLLASASDDGTVRLWHPLATRPAVKTLLGHGGGVASVAFAAGAGGRPLLVSGGSDATVRVWAVGSVSGAVTIRRPSAVRVVAASGLMLAVGQDEGFAVIELDPDTPPL